MGVGAAFPPGRTRGILIALGGVVAVSPDAMLLRWMHSLGASSPDVAVAKYIGIIACMLIIGGSKGLSGARASTFHFFASAACQLLYQLSFTFCLLLTDAATALLLISLAPLWAALLGVLTMDEALPRRTVIALTLSVVAATIVFMPRLLLKYVQVLFFWTLRTKYVFCSLLLASSGCAAALAARIIWL